MLARPFYTFLLACLFATALAAQVETITVDGKRFLAQRAAHNKLHLHPNSCFFDGAGLQCKGQGPEVAEGDQLNKGRSFSNIAGVARERFVSWYVHVPTEGACNVTLLASKAVKNAATIELLLGEQRIALGNTPATLQFEQAGVHRIRVTSTDETPTSIRGLELTGDCLEGSSLLRTRWRPAAAHAKFHASTLPHGARVWIMEMDAAPGDARFYSPMTTPFGYFGPSWTAEGIPTGMNFSMWSFGRGKEEPPIEQLSHLLAVGHPSARFDGFGHEGTGVKLRGWNPFEQWQGQRCVLALRMEPGDPYDTYSGYLFDEVSLTWKLFCAGRKHAAPKKGRRRKQADKNKTVQPGSFVEVPGPPQRQRTGHIVREMRYRGFLLDEQRTPHALDQISGVRKTPVGNQGRGITEDGRFRLWMGGMEQFEESHAQTLPQGHDATRLEWLKPEKLKAVFTWPTTVKITAAELKNDLVRVTCETTGIGKATRVALYVGAKDALTFADRWDHAIELDGLPDGPSFVVKRATRTARFARLLVENEHGKFWSFESFPISVQ